MHKGHISMLGSSKPLFTKPSDFLLFFRFILWIWVFWTQIQIYRQNQNLWIFFKYIIWSKTINLEMSKIDSLEICISNVLWHIFQACGSSGPLCSALGLNMSHMVEIICEHNGNTEDRWPQLETLRANYWNITEMHIAPLKYITSFKLGIRRLHSTTDFYYSIY